MLGGYENLTALGADVWLMSETILAVVRMYYWHFVSGETWSWVAFLQISRGLWLRPAGDAVYVLINDGASVSQTGSTWTGNKIDLARIEHRDDRTTIHIVEGNRPFLVLHLPLDQHAKPID